MKITRVPVVTVIVDDAARQCGEDRQQGDDMKDLAFHLFSPGAIGRLKIGTEETDETSPTLKLFNLGICRRFARCAATPDGHGGRCRD